MIVYVSIGNTDDRLTQAEWAAFVAEVEFALPSGGWTQRHGRWRSPSDDPWQNACWCIEINDHVAQDSIAACNLGLAAVARKFRQDSVAWAEVTKTEFIGATP